jgi:outer membrane protein assembly factor BamA
MRAAVFAVILLSAAAIGSAQQAAPADPDEYDVGQLLRDWRNKPPRAPIAPGDKMIVAAPIIGSNPSAGFLLGAAAQMAFFAGDPAMTRISSGIASFSVSTKKQVLFNIRFDAFSAGNQWLIKGDNRFQSTSQNVYGFGSDTPGAAGISATYGFVRLQETVYHRVANDIYVGGGFLFDSHTNVEPANASDPAWPTSPYIIYSQQNGLPTDSQQSAGFSVNAIVNRRDNDISARRGWMISGRYRWSFDGFLGSDSSWQELDADARAYLPLDAGSRHRLAFWTYTGIVTTGIAPYFDTPATVMDTYGRSARAYQEGRYRGEKLVYGEAEYRGPLMSNGLLGMVAFVNVTTVSNGQTGEALFDSLAPAAGGGLRLLLNKVSRTHLCLDFAWGKDGSKGVYLAIQDAF